jgi:apyrase
MDGTGSSSMKVRPGLTGFAGDPEGAGDSIARLVRFARRRVPKAERRNTKIQLMARAELESLGPELRERILESCRRVLRSSEFMFKDEWARVIRGNV